MLPILPVIQKEAWAQCENPNCGKWRKLPPGSAVDENAAWYCYMNPDETHNTCSASEAEYDEEKEFVIADTNDTEEAARNREIIEKLEASIAAAAAAAPKGRAGRGGSRKSGRSGRGGKSAAVYGNYPILPPVGGNLRRRSSRPLAEEDHDGNDSGLLGAGAFLQPVRQTRRQCARSLQRLMENRGSWEKPSNGLTIASANNPVPPEAWEALAQYGGTEATELAVTATDLATCAAYFESTADGRAMAEEADSVARLAVTLASAAGTVANEDVFVGMERKKLGLEGMNENPPNPEKPLDAQDDDDDEQQQQQPMDGDQQMMQDIELPDGQVMTAVPGRGVAIVSKAELQTLQTQKRLMRQSAKADGQ